MTCGGDLSREAWTERARCRGASTRLFFPESSEQSILGVAFCKRCPVREACLAAALAEPELLGIWGGTTERERRRMRRPAVASTNGRS